MSTRQSRKAVFSYKPNKMSHRSTWQLGNIT